MVWIDLVDDKDKWRALVNAVMNFGFHKMRRIFWLAENQLASQEGLCSTELVMYAHTSWYHCLPVTCLHNFSFVGFAPYVSSLIMLPQQLPIKLGLCLAIVFARTDNTVERLFVNCTLKFG